MCHCKLDGWLILMQNSFAGSMRRSQGEEKNFIYFDVFTL